MKFCEYFLVFAVGGVVYSFIECLWRAHTHPSMACAGAVCFFCLYIMNGKFHTMSPIKRALMGAGVITAVEFILGCLLNLVLGLNVWNYSNLYFNFLGQISLLYSFLWFLLCIPAFWLCSFIKTRIFYGKV